MFSKNFTKQFFIAGLTNNQFSIQHRASKPCAQIVQHDKFFASQPQLFNNMTADVAGASSN